MTDKCIYCGHEDEYNDYLISYQLPTSERVWVCQDALACGRRRQKAEDERRDPPGEVTIEAPSGDWVTQKWC